MNELVPFNQQSLRATPAFVDIPLGTAQWQKPSDGAVKTFEHGDFFIGFDQQGRWLGVNDDRHILVDGASRGGKGAGLIVQNLLMWKGPAIVIDPKGENAMITARRRGNGSRFSVGMGQNVRILDPFDSVKTPLDDFADLKVCFNPLDTLSASREESVDDAARIAEALIVSENSSDPFFDDSARIALKGIILHVSTWHIFPAQQRNLNTVAQLVMSGDLKGHALSEMAHGKKAPSPFQLLFSDMQRNKVLSGVIANVGGMLADLDRNSPRTLASIMQTVRTNIEFLQSPAMKRSVARSDFSLEELKTSWSGVTLYLCLLQRYIETHYRWLRMMVTLIVTQMEQTRSMPIVNRRILMVLDEFPALRRMRVIENASAQIAGFGVKLMFVTQALTQLKDLYKDNWETLLANCGLKQFFCVEDHFSREYVSKLIGDTEVVRTGRNASGTKGTSTSQGHSTTQGSSLSFTEGSSYSSGSGNGFGSWSFSSSSTQGFSNSSSRSTTEGTSESVSAGMSESVQRRPLITPDEVGRLFGDRENPTALTLVSGHQPLFVKRKYYFNDLNQAGFYDPHPDHPLPMTWKEAMKAREAVKVEHEARQRRAREQEAARQKEILERAERKKHEEEERKRRMQAAREAHAREYDAWLKRRARRWLVFCLTSVGLVGLMVLALT